MKLHTSLFDAPRPSEQRAERVARERVQEAQWKREQDEYEIEARGFRTYRIIHLDYRST